MVLRLQFFSGLGVGSSRFAHIASRVGADGTQTRHDSQPLRSPCGAERQPVRAKLVVRPRGPGCVSSSRSTSSTGIGSASSIEPDPPSRKPISSAASIAELAGAKDVLVRPVEEATSVSSAMIGAHVPIRLGNGDLAGCYSAYFPELRGEIGAVERRALQELARFLARLIDHVGQTYSARTRDLFGIASSCADGVIVAGGDGLVIAWNAGAEALFGFRAEEAVGRPLDRFLRSGADATSFRASGDGGTARRGICPSAPSTIRSCARTERPSPSRCPSAAGRRAMSRASARSSATRASGAFWRTGC